MRSIVVGAVLSLLVSLPASAQRRADRFVAAIDTPAKQVTVDVPEERSAWRTIGDVTLTGATAGAVLGVIVSSAVCALTTPYSHDAWEDDEDEPCPFTKWVWAPPLIGAGGGAAVGLLAGVMYVAGENLAGVEPEQQVETEDR